MIPNKKNFCGGAYQDWLEVKLTGSCNGKCSWCIDRGTYNPEKEASWQEIAQAAIKAKQKNIILLGGEPLLYHSLDSIITKLCISGKNVYLTTNGYYLTKEKALELLFLEGINISVHHYDFDKNEEITGLAIPKSQLLEAVHKLNMHGIVVRFNCNLIKGYIDSKKEILSYIEFAKEMGADSVRFAELKGESNSFVDLYKIFGDQFGINNDPFKFGCVSEGIIDNMRVSFRQMCGLQNSLRPIPKNPKQYLKQVLYNDGKIYDGWQTKGGNMKTDKKVEGAGIQLGKAKKEIERLKRKIKKLQKESKEIKKESTAISNGGCCY